MIHQKVWSKFCTLGFDMAYPPPPPLNSIHMQHFLHENYVLVGIGWGSKICHQNFVQHVKWRLSFVICYNFGTFPTNLDVKINKLLLNKELVACASLWPCRTKLFTKMTHSFFSDLDRPIMMFFLMINLNSTWILSQAYSNLVKIRLGLIQ